MKFLKALDEEFSKKLKKVRVKTDPLWAEKLGLYNAPPFEGYVLNECPGMVKIFIVNNPNGINPVQEVPTAAIEQEAPAPAEPDQIAIKNISRLNLFKKAIISKLKDLGKCETDPEVAQIVNSNDVGFIESYLRQIGLNDEDLLQLYRKCIKRI